MKKFIDYIKESLLDNEDNIIKKNIEGKALMNKYPKIYKVLKKEYPSLLKCDEELVDIFDNFNEYIDGLPNTYATELEELLYILGCYIDSTMFFHKDQVFKNSIQNISWLEDNDEFNAVMKWIERDKNKKWIDKLANSILDKKIPNIESLLKSFAFDFQGYDFDEILY